MDRKIDNTVRIGIDLGTTNSAIAVSDDNEIKVVKNMLGESTTPSVFGVDKQGNEIVGKRAYEKLYIRATEDEIANNKAEVKRLMGTDEKVEFPRINEKLSPEEISSKILVQLRNDASRQFHELPMHSAIITVPAHFETPQNEATIRAGKLAGFDQVTLLQEPIAAAFTHGFRSDKSGIWLVYDFGGGTFDVSLISSSEGHLSVLEHGGDNFLGGKDIDDLIVQKIILPELQKDYTFTKINKQSTTYAKLKAIAESCKIQLSNVDNVGIEVEDITDDNNEDVYLSFAINREDFNLVVADIVDKTISITQKVITDSNIEKTAIDKVILVGGSSQISLVRSKLEQELKISIDTSVDPLTAVAQGACIYGQSVQVADDIKLANSDVLTDETYRISLNYEPMTIESDEFITGLVENLPENGDYYIRIVSEDGAFNSDSIKINDGKFAIDIVVAEYAVNNYWIYLIDEKGNNLPIFPDSFTITHGLSVSGIPIPHAIGVIYIEKEDDKMVEKLDEYFSKNSFLPLTNTSTYKTISEIRRDREEILPINIYEGDSKNASGNLIITRIGLSGSLMPYNLPPNTEVEVTISIDESRKMSVDAYIPSVDVTVDARVDVNYINITKEQLREDFDKLLSHYLSLSQYLSAVEEQKIEDLYSDTLDNLEEIEKTDDVEVRQKTARQIRNLKAKLQSIESQNQNRFIIDKINARLDTGHEYIKILTDESEVQKHETEITTKEEELQKLIDNDADKYELNSFYKKVDLLVNGIYWKNDESYANSLEYWKQNLHRSSNPNLMNRLLENAQQAKDNGSVEEFKDKMREAWKFAPEKDRSATMNVQGVTK